MAFHRNSRCFSLLLLLASSLLGQRETPTSAMPSAATPVVVLLGASLTAGYAGRPFSFDGDRNGTARLQRVVSGFWGDGQILVKDRSDMATFIDPLGKQSRRVQRVVGEHPDLVLAIDFMFWFGYGRALGEEREARLARQQEGFALLAEIECPILLGDYPDMRGADARILRPSYVPNQEMLGELNRRLLAFVAEHENMHLFPLAEWVRRAINEGEDIDHGGRRLRVAPLALLQQDRLHANRLGMALLGLRIAERLGQILPPESPLVPRGVTLEVMVERCRAELAIDELEVLQTETRKGQLHPLPLSKYRAQLSSPSSLAMS